MLENECYEVSQQRPSPTCSSSIEVTNSEMTKSEEENNIKLFEAAYKSILDELVDDAMWELCFEVHRAAKLGYLATEEPEISKYQVPDDAEKDIFGQTLKPKVQTFQILCPMCKKKSCATKFASHLAKCTGISGRNSSRAANKKIAAANASGSDLDENDYESDSSFSSKKRSKKNQPKKNSRKKAKTQGNSLAKPSPENSANYQEMTYEKRMAFLNQKCGVISKRTNKMCMNPHKCSQHTDEQRSEVRHILLRDKGDQITNDGQIDVDTVDEGSGSFSFITQSLPACSAPSKSLSSTADFDVEKKPPASSKNSAAQFRKKKSFDSHNLVSNSSQIMPTGSSFESL